MNWAMMARVAMVHTEMLLYYGGIHSVVSYVTPASNPCGDSSVCGDNSFCAMVDGNPICSCAIGFTLASDGRNCLG